MTGMDGRRQPLSNDWEESVDTKFKQPHFSFQKSLNVIQHINMLKRKKNVWPLPRERKMIWQNSKSIPDLNKNNRSNLKTEGNILIW